MFSPKIYGWAAFRREAAYLRGKMSTGQQAKFYKTTAWVNCRKGYLAKVGGLCERCLAKGLIVPAEIIHHKIHLTEENITDPSVALNFDNLEALCRVCHGEAHGRPKRYTIAADGSVEPRADAPR